MLTYTLEKRGKTPIYEYLYNCIKEDIMSGKLKAGTKLPSKREMASNMGISVITVTNAYEQLVVEGYINAIEKRGYFVNEIALAQRSITRDKTSGSDISTDSAEGTDTDYIIDFTSSHIRYDGFPFNTWSKVMRRTLSDNENDFLQRPDSNGVPELREAIADYLSNHRGMSVKKDNIIVGAGMEYLYGLIVKLLGADSTYAIEDPGHQKIGKIYDINQVETVHIPVDEDGFRSDMLTDDIKVCHITPSHHFPTGYVMPISRRYELLNWASTNNGYIIEDDYDSEFRFHGRMIPTMQSLNPDRVIYLNTFSKTLAPSIRIAYMVLPDELMRQFEEKLGFYASTVSGLDQYVLARFIKEGYYGRHINRMRNYYRQYQNTILKTLMDSPLGNQIKIKEADAGLHFIIEVNEKIDALALKEKLIQNKINITSVADYCYKDKKYNNQFIVNYSAIEQADLEKAIKIMGSLINELKKTSNDSKNQIEIVLPKNVQTIIHILEENGFEAFAVGGCVRDSILGKEPKDWDITTSAKPEEVKKIFRKTIDTGIEHGTVTVRMRGESYEVTTYRIDGDYSDSRHPESVSYTDSLREDLKRRDFTINAMAYNESRGLVDEFGGIDDLNNGIIKCVGEPLNRFDEDALRIMRGIRFAAQLGFEIDDKTKKAMTELAPNLENISMERIQVELEKLIMSDHPEKIIDAYDLEITKYFLPEFDAMMECEQLIKYHLYDVGVHTVVVMQNTPKDKLLRWTALLHDVAKPIVKEFYDGETHFKEHDIVGAKMARKIMKRLRMDNDTIKKACVLIEHHDDRQDVMEGKFTRRLVAAVGKDLFPQLLIIMQADLAGKSDVAREKNGDNLANIEREYNIIMENNIATSIKELAVTGKDLIDIGVKPGKAMGEILNQMLEEVLTDPERNTREYLLNLDIVAKNT